MKNIIITILLLSAMILCADVNDPLWQKASEIAKANWNQVAGFVEIENAAIMDDGNEMMNTDLMFSYELEDGNVAAYYDGGKRAGSMIPESDVMVQEMLKQDMRPDSASIFYNDGSWQISAQRTGNQKKIKKFNCVEFTYSGFQPGEDGEMIPISGSVWLDSETGAPVYNEQNMKPPAKEVKNIDNEIFYSYKKGKWLIDKLVSIVDVEAMGQKIKMKYKSEFSKYWTFPAE